MGISFRSTAMEVTEEIKRIAHCINETVSLNGAWFFQVKKDRNGALKLMEFAPRQFEHYGAISAYWSELCSADVIQCAR